MRGTWARLALRTVAVVAFSLFLLPALVLGTLAGHQSGRWIKALTDSPFLAIAGYFLTVCALAVGGLFVGWLAVAVATDILSPAQEGRSRWLAMRDVVSNARHNLPFTLRHLLAFSLVLGAGLASGNVVVLGVLAIGYVAILDRGWTRERARRTSTRAAEQADDPAKARAG